MKIEYDIFLMPEHTVDPKRIEFNREGSKSIGQRIDPMGKDMAKVHPTRNYPDPYTIARKLFMENMNA